MHLAFFTIQLWAKRLNKVCALLAAAQLLVLTVLAVCPAAHEWLHSDASHPNHECAITLFTHGVTATITPITLGLIAWWLVRTLVLAAVDFNLGSPRYRLLPGRAPPGR